MPNRKPSESGMEGLYYYMDLSNMMTLAQWAKDKGVKTDTARKWVQRNKIPYENVGGFYFVSADTEIPVDNRKNDFLKNGNIPVFTERLKSLRNEKNVTQKTLADYCGIDQTTYAPYETGGNVPPVDRIKMLAEYFGVTVDYLMGKSDDR